MGVAAAALLTVVSIAGVQPFDSRTLAQDRPQGAPAQPPPPTGLILGRVVDGTSGRPVGGAIVTLEGLVPVNAGGISPPRAMTNAAGQFVFRRLPQGSFTLLASKHGYADGAYGRRRPGGSMARLQLAQGERAGDVAIRLWRYGVIAGTVSDEAGEPMVSVQVRAFQRRQTGGRRRIVEAGTAQTDDRGIYRFGSLTPGEYLIAFVSRVVSLPAATAEMLRSPSNDPRTRELMRERMGLGLSMAAPGSAGAVHIGGLVRQLDSNAPVPPPAAESGPVFIYPTQFFPGVASAARAGVIQIGSGQIRETVDFALRPARASRVSGMVIGPDGPAANVALRLVPASQEFATDLETSGTLAGPDGEFTFLGVPAGQYVVKVMRVPRATPAPQATTQIQVGSTMIVSSSGVAGAHAPIPDDPTIFAEMPLTVADADLGGIVVPLQRGARITGRVEFEGTTERPQPQALSRIPIVTERVDAGASQPASFSLTVPPGAPDESGAFKTYGLPAGKYVVRIGVAPIGWYLKSIVSEGRDVSDAPLELRGSDVANVVITFTDRPSKLSGIARTSAGHPDPDALVVVFPTDSAAWKDFGLSSRRMRTARPGKTGSYSFTGLPAGEYFVAGIREDAIAQWQDPQVLEELSRSAATVRLSDGETRVQDVKTIGDVR